MSSLSEDERKELERFRTEKESKEKYAWAVTKGMALGLTSYQFFSYFTPDTVFGRSVRIFGMLVCFAVGILSSYYGPFADKKKEVKTVEPSLSRDKPKGEKVK